MRKLLNKLKKTNNNKGSSNGGCLVWCLIGLLCLMFPPLIGLVLIIGFIMLVVKAFG